MILAVDPGYAKCGWAIVDRSTGLPRKLGVIVTEQRSRRGHSTDRALRMTTVATQLRELALENDATAIAAEQALGYGAAAAVAANQLPWGALIMLAVVLGVELLEVPAKTWQRAVLGIDGKVNYPTLERAMTAFVGRHCSFSLDCIEKKLRNHALDACGVGLLAAKRPSAAARVAGANA